MMTSPEEFEAQRRKIIKDRNRMLGLVLAGFAVLFFAISIAKMSH